MKKIFVGILAILSLKLAVSQTASINTGSLYISTGSDIFYAGGNFTNTSTLLRNNGQLYVKGNLTNNQTPAIIGTGTLYLNGTAAQTVGGTASFKTFNLNTNNTSGGIDITTNLSVSGTHTFTSGLITTAASRYLIYEDNATNTGASDAAHVNGWVKKLGDDNFTFPVGNASRLREIAISGLSSSSEFNAQYSGTTTNTSNLQSPLVAINPNEYWTLDKVSGSGTIAVTLNWNNAKVAFPHYVLSDLRAAQYTASKWTSTGANNITGTVLTSGTITSDPFSFSGAMPLSIGSTTFVVPLFFLELTAQNKEEYTLVQWKTAQEQNVKMLEVQRSGTGNNFITIGQVSPHNTFTQQLYEYKDLDNLNGTNFYRIKSIDFDGNIKYSKVVSISVNESTQEITLLNNPVKDAINLSINNSASTLYHYNLISTNGSTLQQGDIKFNGRGSMSISLSSYVLPGTYMVMISSSKKLFTHKIIVE